MKQVRGTEENIQQIANTMFLMFADSLSDLPALERLLVDESYFMLATSARDVMTGKLHNT